MAMDFAVGAGSGIAAQKILDVTKSDEPHPLENMLIEIGETLAEIHRYFQNQPVNKLDLWTPLRIFTDHKVRIPWAGYKNQYIFFGVASHVQLDVPMLSIIDWNPEVGMNLLKFPEGTQIALVDPTPNILTLILNTEETY